MTLILVMGNSEQVIQVSDRRVSQTGKKPKDESNKAGIFICDNARLAFSFTGLAKIGTFNTFDWVFSELNKCAPPDFLAGKTLTKLTANITDYFKSNPTLKRLSPANKRLTLVFIGYSYSFAPPRGIFSIISNFETIKDGICRAEALDHFIHEESHEIRPNDDSLGIVFPFGMWTSINKKEIEDLNKMVLDKKPPNALIGMAHKIIINAADHSASKQTIGKQMSSIILPRIRINPVQTSYHTNVNSYENYGVPYLFATSSATTVIGGSTLTSFGEGGDKDRKFSAIPKVKMDRPCPCGSGKRYKYCHGINI